jgi:group I intron endonuclease
MVAVVYLITNLIDGRKYVGQTREGLAPRFARHAKSKWMIGRAIRKHGADAFSVAEIERCDTQAQLDERERFWIAYHGCREPAGYNLTDGGGGAAGYKFDEVGRARIRAGKQANPMSPEGKERVRAAQTGRFVSAETRARISASKRGQKLPARSDEHRRKLGLAIKRYPHRGPKQHTAETRARMSEVQLLRRAQERAAP